MIDTTRRDVMLGAGAATIPIGTPEPAITAGAAKTQALAAMAAQDWNEALRLWDLANSLDPSIDANRGYRGTALLHIEEQATVDGIQVPVNIERVENPGVRAMLMQFESLGENCEFGLVQRRFGAEPLGLMRWSYASPQTLIALLQSRFKGVGSPESLGMTRASWGEYFLKDRISGLPFHTYVNDCGPDEGKFLKKQSDRIVWLREKLIADLEDGRKTFVYKFHYGWQDAVITQLLSAIKGYSKNNRLLIVRLANDGAPAGSIVSPQDGLIEGYIGSVQPTAGGIWNISYDDWLSICRLAAT